MGERIPWGRLCIRCRIRRAVEGAGQRAALCNTCLRRDLGILLLAAESEQP